MQLIPLTPVPSQVRNIVLGGQNCDISIYQKSRGMYLDLSVDQVRIVTGALIHDGQDIITQKYRGFKGNLVFVDTAGSSDPTYDGIGTRYVLLYKEDGE